MHVGPVIAVKDLEEARAFYEGKLGLEGEEAPGGWVINADGGSRIYLLPGIEEAGTAGWPLASFQVDDIVGKVRELRGNGVEFLGDDDLPFDLDEDGISGDTTGMKVAWMKDPDGAVLTVFSLA